MRPKLLSCGISDIGKVRQNNEDVWAELPDIGLFVLADGMGGHQAGEVAAREAVETFCAEARLQWARGVASVEEAISAIRKAFYKANDIVYAASRGSVQLRGMGSTLCALHVGEQKVVYAHVGDSRIYRYRNKVIEPLTQDHSLLRELLDIGAVAEEQVRDQHYKNIITKAIGTEPGVDPTISSGEWQKGDIYLLCSDGLSDLLSVSEIEMVLERAPSLIQAASELISLTYYKGGYDNITLIIVHTP